MATIETKTTTPELALAFQPAGYEQIPGSTILTRLNYFDGKFLRADDLRLEQDYLRRLAELDARAGGSGLVYGYDVSLGSGDGLTIGGGLAFDGSGRVVYMPSSFTVGLQELIDRTSRMQAMAQSVSAGSSSFEICLPENGATKPAGPAGAEFYLITIAHAEEACGEEEVFGRLCDDGCTTSTDRAYLVEGVIVRATPFQPRTPFISSTAVRLTEAHVRSQLVSAYFADEKDFVPCQISKAGLASGVWCNGAAAPSGWEVPIAVVGRLSSSTFVDDWVVRRERIETPPRRYWAGRMCMRPWDAFLAQVLQFQCQLPSVLAGRGGDATAVDPCSAHVDVIRQVSSYVTDLARVVAAPVQPPITAEVMLVKQPGAADSSGNAPTIAADSAHAPAVASLQLDAPLHLDAIHSLQLKLADVLAKADLPSQHILLDGGFVELPPAGYLPVTIGSTPPVDEQVRRLMGAGVDLRFCVTTPDYIPHALEKAQHMDRISLVQGLDDPANKPKVDVLVPNGVLGAPAKPARGWDTTITLSPNSAAAGSVSRVMGAAVEQSKSFRGAGRSAVTAAGGAEFEFAGLEQTSVDASPLAVYGALTCDRNPFELAEQETFTVNAEAALYEVLRAPFGESVTASGTFTVVSHKTVGAGVEVKVTGSLSGSGSTTEQKPISFTFTSVTLAIAAGAAGCKVVATIDQGPQAGDLVVATLADDPQVFSPQDALHKQALEALKKLASVLGAQYTDTVPAKLFDPNATAAADTGVTATLDWVLFHRRRRKDCRVVPVAPPAPKTQSYRAYYASVNPGRTFASSLKAITAAIQKDASLDKYFKEIGQVGFNDQVASLAMDPQDVAAAWRGVSPGSRIVLGAAAGPDTDPDTLLENRITAYQEAVKQFSAPVGEKIIVHHPALTSLAAGPDGQLLFVTETDAIGYEVLAAFSDEGSAALKALVSSKSVDAFRNDPHANALGTISFNPGTATPVDQALKDLASAMKKMTTVLSALVFTEPGQTTAEDVKAQADVIIKAVGGTKRTDFTFHQYEAKFDTPAPGTSLVCVLDVVG